MGDNINQLIKEAVSIITTEMSEDKAGVEDAPETTEQSPVASDGEAEAPAADNAGGEEEMPSASDDSSDEEKKPKAPKITINKSMGVNKEYTEKMEKDRSTRFDYLLKQTGIFSHFLNAPGKKPPKSPLKMKLAAGAEAEAVSTSEKGKGKGKASKGAKDTRHRRTEKDEDAELLEDSKHAQSTVLQFTESPTYIKNGTMRDYQIRGLNWMISLYENGI